jgi:hypothetical protein
MGQIINKDMHAYRAPLHWLNQLAINTPDYCLINGGGEVAPMEGTAMAGYIKKGHVVLDYCGYPMYYYKANGYIKQQGESGFANFLRGVGLYFQHDFWSDGKWDWFWKPTPGEYPYPRSLVLRDGLPSYLIINPYSYHTQRTFSSFALKIGQGYYFYAFCWPEGMGLNPPGVVPEDYIKFVKETLPQVQPPKPSQPPTDGEPSQPPTDGEPTPPPIPPPKPILPLVFLGGTLVVALTSFLFWRSR